jgi:excisionase family DNA binding protein
MEPLAVDIQEAGRLLSLSPRTIRRHIQSGRIKGVVRIGRRVLVPVETLKEMVREASPQRQSCEESIVKQGG